MKQKVMKAGIGVVLALGLQGFASAADKASMVYDSSAADVEAVPLVASCVVNIVGMTDGRNNQETIGNGERAILADDVLPWVGNAMDRLGAYGYTVQHSKTPVDGAINLDIGLLRAYTFLGPMRINGMVVLDVDVAAPGKAVRRQKFRSLGSKTNMADMTSEYPTALNYAVNNAVDKMAKALQADCTRKTAP